MLPLGHLLVDTRANDDPGEAYIYTNQSGLDTRPSPATYHMPRPNAFNQPRMTLTGLIIHETLDNTNVNSSTILVRPLGGQAIQTLVASADNDVITVAPLTSLQPNTTYEVQIVGGGIKDVAGNALQPYNFRFSTGCRTNIAAATISPLQADTMNRRVYLHMLSRTATYQQT